MKPRAWLSGLLLCTLLLSGLPGRTADVLEGAGASVTHVNPKEAQKLLSNKTVIVLDIRTPGEFKSTHIAGATNIDFLAPDFEQKISRLDPNKTYLVHCASGGRSTHSLPVLKNHHFQLLYHLDGGLKAWEKEGLPVEKGK